VWVRYGDGSVSESAWDRLRLSDFDGSVPWREARARRGQIHYSGLYASATTGGFVAYESRPELARVLLADFDPQVRWIYAQPFRLVVRIDGRVRSHVPDLLLVTAAETGRLANVKPAGPRNRNRLAPPQHPSRHRHLRGGRACMCRDSRSDRPGGKSRAPKKSGSSLRNDSSLGSVTRNWLVSSDSCWETCNVDSRNEGSSSPLASPQRGP
jgi:hypothetical protein